MRSGWRLKTEGMTWALARTVVIICTAIRMEEVRNNVMRKWNVGKCEGDASSVERWVQQYA